MRVTRLKSSNALPERWIEALAAAQRTHTVIQSPAAHHLPPSLPRFYDEPSVGTCSRALTVPPAHPGEGNVSRQPPSAREIHVWVCCARALQRFGKRIRSNLDIVPVNALPHRTHTE